MSSTVLYTAVELSLALVIQLYNINIITLDSILLTQELKRFMYVNLFFRLTQRLFIVSYLCGN